MASEIQIGTPVTFKFGDILKRMRVPGSANSVNRRWEKIRDINRDIDFSQPGLEEHIVHGFIVGKRTLSNGLAVRGYRATYLDEGEPDSYTVVETLQAYLVAEGLRGAFMKVRVEDVTLLSPEG